MNLLLLAYDFIRHKTTQRDLPDLSLKVYFNAKSF